MLNPGLKIAEYRIHKGWTQAELSQKAGLAQANLSNIEKGKKDFTVSTLIRLASALETDPAVFLISEKPASSEQNWTRQELETLADAVVNPKLKVSARVRKDAERFRNCLSETNRSGSVREAEQAWYQIRQKFSSQQIRNIRQRVEDARLRHHEKKTN